MASRKIVSLTTALLAALAGAGRSGLVVSEAAAQLVAKRDDEETAPPLLLAPSDQAPVFLAGHRSHSSHRSHNSHSSHYSGSRSRSYHYSSSNYGSTGNSGSQRSYDSGDTSTPAPAPKPRPVAPARVSFVAVPGGRIEVDGVAVGQDKSGVVKLSPGTHSITVVNRFLGTKTVLVTVTEGQTGVITISPW